MSGRAPSGTMLHARAWMGGSVTVRSRARTSAPRRVAVSGVRAAAAAESAAGAQVKAEDFVRPHLKTMAAYTPIEPFEVSPKGSDAAAQRPLGRHTGADAGVEQFFRDHHVSSPPCDVLPGAPHPLARCIVVTATCPYGEPAAHRGRTGDHVMFTAVRGVAVQVLSQKLGRKPEDIVKLDANENPYGPPPGACVRLLRGPRGVWSLRSPVQVALLGREGALDRVRSGGRTAQAALSRLSCDETR